MPYVQQRRGTASALASANEIPLAGQIVIETDTGKMKVGNGTTAYAGLEYITDASNIADGSIGTSKITDLNVTASKLADDAVTTAKIADNAVTAAHLQDGTVTSTEIADNAVTTAKIIDNAVTSAKIAADAVTATEIAANSVNSSKIAANAVTSTEIADDAVTLAKMQDVSANSLLGAVSAGEVTQIVCRQIGRDILEDSTAADVRTTIGAVDQAAVNTSITNAVSGTANIADDAVTYAKIQNVSAGKILGNPQTTDGNVEEIQSTIFGRSLLNSASSNALATTLGVATTSQITAAINNVIDAAPGALDTLNELAAAIGDDASFSTNVTNSIAAKLPLAGGTVTGDIDMQRAQTGSPLTTTSPTKLDWGNSNGGAFSNAATDLDYVRLYSSGTTVAGMGITTSNFNIGTNGPINVSIYAAGVLNERKTGTLSRHYVNQFYNEPIYTAGGSATLPVISKEGDPDTGIYYPSLGAFAITADGDQKIKVTNNQVTVSRTAGYPTIKADATGVNDVAGGWMIIDSSTNNCALNYYSGADVSLAYGGGGATVGTVGQGSYKFRVHGGQSHFSNAITVAADAVYAPVYRSSTDGTVGAAAYGREYDGNTGMFFPAADKVALTAGGVECIRGATASGTTVVSSSHLIDTTNFIYANGYRAKNPGSASDTAFGLHGYGGTGMYFPTSTGGEVGIAVNNARKFNVSTSAIKNYLPVKITDGTNTSPSIQFSSDTDTGIYRVSEDRIGIVTGGAARFQIGDTGGGHITASLGSTPQAAYKFYSVMVVTDFTSSQNGVFSGTHTITDASTHHTIGVNGSSYRTFTTDNITNSSYNRAGHFAATTRTQTGVVAGQTIGVYALANHDNSTAGTTSLIGVQGLCYQSSHGCNAPTAYGLFGRVAIVDGDTNTSITSAYGLYGDITKANGTITNGYGLYLGDINATNKYGVYQLDTEATNVFQGRVQFASSSGSAGSYLPGISFIGDGNTGIGRTVSDVVDVVCGGNIVGDFRTGGIRMINGTSASCAYAFQEDADTGMFRSTSTGLNLQWAGSGIQIANAYINNQKQLRIPDGTATDPAIAFANDPDTGIRRNSNGNFDIVTAGTNKLSITTAGDIYTASGRTVVFNGSISDGTTSATAAQLLASISASSSTPPDAYGQNLLFG
tara:strand:- start:26388 stop:29837 length:3450 start_codon:yes stop_codon:yes gene_type:complete